MSTVSDDEIIKRKLLIEGESGNDDRRITLLLKNYLRWTVSEDMSDDGFEVYQALVASVYQCENAMEQSSLVIAMNDEQQTQYDQLYEQIAKSRIEKCKEDLRAAKVVRKNRKEYHSLAKLLAEHPERNQTLEKYKKLDSQFDSLKQLNKEFDRKIQLRKAQFHLFLFALKGLQTIIDEDTESLYTEDSFQSELVIKEGCIDDTHMKMDTC